MTGKTRQAFLALALGFCWDASAIAAAVGPGQASNRQLVELTDIDSVGVTPDDRFVIFRTTTANIERNSYDLSWHSIDLRSGTKHDLGSGGEAVYLDPGSIEASPPIWLDNARTFIIRALIDGAVGLWRIDPDGRQKIPVIVRDEDIMDYSARPDGKSLSYTVGPSRAEIMRAERLEYDQGILIDSTIDLSQNLFRGGSINGRMASQRLVGYWYVRGGLLWRGPHQQRVHDVISGNDVPLGAPKLEGPFQPPRQSAAAVARNGNGDVVEAAWDGRKGALKATLQDGRTVTCSHPLCSVSPISSLVWRPRSSDVIVTVTDRERRQSLYRWSVSENRFLKLSASDGLLGGGRRPSMPCAVSSVAAYCVSAGPASPPRLERIDLVSGDRRSMHDPNGDFRGRYTPTVRYLRWPLSDGRVATGVMLSGNDKAINAPLFVNYYACDGFLRGGEGDEWPFPALLDAGFVVACINSVPFKGMQDAVQTYRTGHEAVRALISNLVAAKVVDRSKVAMGGLSFGSEVAMWTASHSGLLAAVSIASSQIEPAEYWLGSMPGSDHADFAREVWGLGRPQETPKQWKQVSPAFNVAAIKAPILFQLPEQEARRIPELYSRLWSARTPTELYAFPDEAHIKLQPRHRLAVYDRNLDWFRYWLQGVRDTAPAKVEQYKRWDLLRERRMPSDLTQASATTAQVQSSR